MINVGTVGAYLTLSTTQFHKGIGDALTQLDRLEQHTRSTASVMDLLKYALSAAALSVNPLILAYNAARSAGTLFATYSSSYISAAARSITGSLTSMGSRLSSLGSTLSSTRNTVSSQSKSIATAVISPLSGLKSSAYKAMANAGTGMVNGLESKRALIIAKARAIANSVAAAIKAALRISSPSKVTRMLGQETGLGFELGLEDAQRGVEERAKMLAAGTGISLEPSSAQQSAQYAAAPSAQQAFTSSRTEQQLDRLIRAVESGDRVLQLDGRTFARLIREYNR